MIILLIIIKIFSKKKLLKKYKINLKKDAQQNKIKIQIKREER